MDGRETRLQNGARSAVSSPFHATFSGSKRFGHWIKTSEECRDSNQFCPGSRDELFLAWERPEVAGKSRQLDPATPQINRWAIIYPGEKSSVMTLSVFAERGKKRMAFETT
ncbi:hypothetical protein NPIL_577651 [Nephila pilipes]|uniref:Uncharacterized protein n=1 Tax=Nephila pilipes TaxID=299642 RepID=A0A8X6QT77_NEPPI|nr:hypothetical protein NPIL_577651 [Nephila pilipes]